MLDNWVGGVDNMFFWCVGFCGGNGDNFCVYKWEYGD